jgi:hypothetical protein
MKIQAPRDEKHRIQLQTQLALSTPAPPGHRYRVRIAKARFGWVAHFRLVPLDSIRSHKKAKPLPGNHSGKGVEIPPA